MIDLISQAPLTFLLLVANVVLSLAAFSNQRFMESYVFHIGPIRYHKQWYRMISSGFLHGGAIHLYLNMYVLWSFGRIMEGYIGTVYFAIIYVLSLFGGSLWSYIENRSRPQYRALGASGALSGVLLSFSMLAPNAMLSLFFFLPMPAWFFAILFVIGSYFLSQRANKIIGHEAHLGGALAGIVATVILFPGAADKFVSAILGNILG